MACTNLLVGYPDERSAVVEFIGHCWIGIPIQVHLVEILKTNGLIGEVVVSKDVRNIVNAIFYYDDDGNLLCAFPVAVGHYLNS